MDKDQLVTVRAKTHFADSAYGSVTRNQQRRVDPVTADRWEALGIVEIVREHPTQPVSSPTELAAAGSGSPSAASLEGQASQPNSADTPSETDGGPSSSTTPGDSPPPPTSSTPATPSGGKSTTKPSPKTSPASSGHKTQGKRK